MVESSARPKTRQRVLVKHSSEVKPTADVEAGTELREYDTGNIFEFSGQDWYKTGTTGSSNINVTNQEADVASIQDSDSFAITGIGATVQINNLDIFDEFSFDITGAGTTDTISITTSKNGVNFSGTKKLCLSTLTGNVAASVDMPTGDYVVPINCKSILVTMSGSTDTHQVTWAARNAGRRRME